jgi:hypothetical protein
MKLSFAAALLLLLTAAQAWAIPIEVMLTVPTAEPVSGRLIIFARPVAADKSVPASVDGSPFAPEGVAVTARDVTSLATGQVVTVDGDADSFPDSFSKLPPGSYRLQAVLDRNLDYNYNGRGDADIVSPVIEAKLPGPVARLELRDVVKGDSPAAIADHRGVVGLDFISRRLSRFKGRPVHIRGWIALPPGYQPKARSTWPVVFSSDGFGSTLSSGRNQAVAMAGRMAKGDFAPMIWVFLDQSLPTGTHEFADSINNGPWGSALTGELIPWLEKTYRMDAKASGRFLSGHSSGGWTALWLQTRYPKLFGGSWSTAPDPSDFHDFSGIDIYAPGANAYVDGEGRPRPLIRAGGKELVSLRSFAQMETVLGPSGGQFSSFEWVFSPRGSDGRPKRLFDRRTGVIDGAVAAYWQDHYDIADHLQRNWSRLRRDLDGKIHVYVGGADTFRLDGSVRRLKVVLDGLGARSYISIIPGRDHFDLLEQDGDPLGLMRKISWDMFATARPGDRAAASTAGSAR